MTVFRIPMIILALFALHALAGCEQIGPSDQDAVRSALVDIEGAEDIAEAPPCGKMRGGQGCEGCECPHKGDCPLSSDGKCQCPHKGDCPMAKGGECPMVKGGNCPAAKGGKCPMAQGGECPMAQGGECPMAQGGECPMKQGKGCPGAKKAACPFAAGGDEAVSPCARNRKAAIDAESTVQPPL